MQEQQQQEQAQGAPIDPEGTAPAEASRLEAPRRRGDDDTWGLGSATALETLRRRNFRGRRPSSTEDRPSSE